MGVSFVLMFIAGIVCALAPQDLIGHGTSYLLFTIGRFFVACATRGIAVTGFVMGMCLLDKSYSASHFRNNSNIQRDRTINIELCRVVFSKYYTTT
jgi:MFS family permease